MIIDLKEMKMKSIFAVALFAATAASSSAFAIEPISGSLNYDGANARLQNAPVGSPVSHQFYSDGNQYRETYVVQQDRSLKLVARTVSDNS